MNIQPVVLQGRHVRLEPLSLDHHLPLCEVGLDEDLWRWIPFQIQTNAEMLQYIRTALQWQTDGTAVPFATVEQTTNKVIGSTRYMNIDRQHKRVEIGSTWVAGPWQRSVVNTEAKYVMLKHAFEDLGCIRVELKTDFLNERSRNAILRIGAKQEGIFRNHIICASGRIRDSVYFSIVDREWPEVKKNLEQKLQSRG